MITMMVHVLVKVKVVDLSQQYGNSTHSSCRLLYIFMGKDAFNSANRCLYWSSFLIKSVFMSTDVLLADKMNVV